MKVFRAPPLRQSSVVHIKAVSEIYWYSGVQMLLVTVFQTAVNPCSGPLCKSSLKTGYLLGYLNGILLNPVRCQCKINFSFLSQIRREHFCFPSKDSVFLLYYFARLQLFRCHIKFGQLFTVQPHNFLSRPTLHAHSLLKNEFFSNVHR